MVISSVSYVHDSMKKVSDCFADRHALPNALEKDLASDGHISSVQDTRDASTRVEGPFPCGEAVHPFSR